VRRQEAIAPDAPLALDHGVLKRPYGRPSRWRRSYAPYGFTRRARHFENVAGASGTLEIKPNSSSSCGATKRGIDLAVEAVVADLVKNSRKVTSNEEIAQVRANSANGDTEIGRYLAGPGRPARTYDVTARLEHYSPRSRRRMGWILPVYGLVLSCSDRKASAQTASTIANRSISLSRAWSVGVRAR
jgi:hypothetical protein